MTGFRQLALIAAILVVVALIVVDGSRPPAGADGRAPARSAMPAAPAGKAAAATNSIVAGELLAPADGRQPLIKVPGLGRFSVRCGGKKRLAGVFTSTADETLEVSVAPSAGHARSAVVDPGKRFAFPPSQGSTTTQRWQLARINDVFSEVTLVFISSSPAYAGNPTCALSAYAIGPTRQPRRK